jgi:hypothetical protein
MKETAIAEICLPDDASLYITGLIIAENFMIRLMMLLKHCGGSLRA